MADHACEFCHLSDCRSVTAPPGDRLVEALNCARRRVGVLEAAGDALAEAVADVNWNYLNSKDEVVACASARDAWTKARIQ